jgi:hypothetical protein
MEALGGRGCIVPRWGLVVSVTPRPCFTPGERTPPPVPIVQEAGWAPEPVCTKRLEEKSFAPAGDRTPIAQPVVRHYTAWANPTPFLPEGNIKNKHETDVNAIITLSTGIYISLREANNIITVRLFSDCSIQHGFYHTQNQLHIYNWSVEKENVNVALYIQSFIQS